MRSPSKVSHIPFFILFCFLSLQGILITFQPEIQPIVSQVSTRALPVSEDDSPRILILYGSPVDLTISKWLSQGQSNVSYFSLSNVSDLFTSTMDWNQLQSVWIINSNDSLSWTYPLGSLFINIFKNDVNLFLISTSLKWIDPFYWSFLGIQDVAWYSEYLTTANETQLYQMRVDEPQFPSSIQEIIGDQVSLEDYYFDNITISARATWVKFNVDGVTNQKIIEVTPLETAHDVTLRENWDSGTLMKITEKNVMFVSTFFPEFSAAENQHDFVRTLTKFSFPVTSEGKLPSLHPLVNNGVFQTLDAWNLLKIISNWTVMFTFSSSLEVPNLPLADGNLMTSFLPYVAFGILALIGLGIIIKTGMFRAFLEKLLAMIITIIFFVGSIAYTPLRRRISEEDLLENEIRRKIVDYLELKGTSGAHLREIQSHVNKSISSVLWHLQTLKDFGLIDSKKVGKYKIFYLTNIQTQAPIEEVKPIDQLKQMEWSTLMKSNLARNIVLLLLNSKKPLKLSEIAKKLKCHHETARYHLLRMLDVGMISCAEGADSKKSMRYYLTPLQRSRLAQLVLNE